MLAGTLVSAIHFGGVVDGAGGGEQPIATNRTRRRIAANDSAPRWYDLVVRRLVVCLLMIATHVAAADPPKGYKCGPGGSRAKDTCKCPDEKIAARDADDKAICAPKPEPKPEACLADRKGKQLVKIDSTPTSATLYLGDKSCGIVAKTPWSGKVQAGPLIVILEQTGYDPQTRTLTVTGSSDLFVPLVRIEIGSIEVRADSDPNAAGAPITVDGQSQGTIPVSIKLRAGRHLVEIAKPGFDNYTQWVEIEEAKTVALLPTLHATVVGKARLVVDADVAQAEVFVDGTRRGTTPIAIDDLPLGTHSISVRKPPAKNWETKLFLGAGSTLVRAELSASMPVAPTDGMLHITADKPGAEVSIDGAVVGKAPLLQKLPAGDHWIQVKLAGHMTFEQKLQLDAGKSLEISAKLVPAGQLTVSSVPAGSTVFIDGVRRGTTPLAIELPVGDHTVIVERAGFQRFERKVKLSDKTTDLAATLVR